MRNFDQDWRRRLTELDASGRLRALTDNARRADGRVDRGATTLIDFSSNDYLGLARHPALRERAADYLQQWGAGSGASRLVTGNLPPFAHIESRLAAAKGAEAALLLVSGFQANVSLLPALLDKNLWGAAPKLFADRLVHASLIQGCLAAGIQMIRFRHNDLDHLASLLQQNDAADAPCFIVSETVFSMDGDRADLAGLRSLADRFGAFLYLDEAHATGLFGPGGFGLAHGMAGENCLVMGTFSKALGGFGAYVACSEALKQFLINRCAGLIYATALPPAILGAIDAALELLPNFESERRHVQELAGYFRDRLREAGENVGESSTQIVPLMVGDEREALQLAAALEAAGFLAIAIRPPTVPPGGSRLRFAFAAHHSRDMVDRLLAELGRLRSWP